MSKSTDGWGPDPSQQAPRSITPDLVADILGPAVDPPFYVRLIGLSPARRLNNITALLQRSQEALVDRPLTTTELSALAQGAAAENNDNALVHLAVTFSALFLTVRGRHKMSFPFYKPKDMNMFKAFPSPTMPFLRGLPASRAWHVARFGAYFTGITLTLGMFLNSIVTRNYIVEKAIDPRLRDYLRETMLDPANQAIITALQKERNIQPIEFRRPDDPAVIRAREIRRNRFYEKVERNMTPVEREKIEEKRRKLEAAETQWREQVAASEMRRKTPVSSPDSVWEQRRNGSVPDVPQVAVSSADDDDDDPFAVDDDEEDDMSPVPAHIRRQEQQEAKKREIARRQPRVEGEVSAWERLRAGAMNADNQTAQRSMPIQPTSQSTEPPASEWGSGGSDKAQAQREFDAMLEAERQSRSSDSKWN